MKKVEAQVQPWLSFQVSLVSQVNAYTIGGFSLFYVFFCAPSPVIDSVENIFIWKLDITALDIDIAYITKVKF